MEEGGGEAEFRSNSFLQMGTPPGTHVDASYHFIKEGVTIDDVPLEKMVGKDSPSTGRFLDTEFPSPKICTISN